MIFYFSGTGNTRWAAIKLATATHERLIDIAEEMRLIKNQAPNILSRSSWKKENGLVSFSPFMVGGFQDLSGNL